jgi:glycosyltransferase involved in cell wall biosynthesis
VVIPVYKHSVLLEEAVISALDQQTDFEICIIIVNDGCPMAETHQACLDFVAAVPNRIHYIRRPNGGLSAARNTGIDYVVGTWETVRAIYFLDADNRLLPGALQRGYDALAEDPKAAWIYPDIDMFGQEWNIDYSGQYTVLRHLDENICEAGSLVRREVFEKGGRFDESMQLGFEDWDFWLTAIELGFRGKHLDNFGFRYRRRPESMLSNSERDRPEILSYIRRKHGQLFRCGSLITLEHREAPRYAIYTHDTGQVSLTSDPASDGKTLSVGEFYSQYYRAKLQPSRYPRPAFIVVAEPAVTHALLSYGLIRWVFWYFESLLDSYNFVYLTLTRSKQPDAIQIKEVPHPIDREAHRASGILMVKANLIDECLEHSDDNWETSLTSSNPQSKIHVVELSLAGYEPSEASAGVAFLELIRDLKRFGADQCTSGRWEWRVPGTLPRSHSFDITRRILGAEPVYPRVPNPGERHIGFVLPIAEFGGVEKVAYNLAGLLKDRGWETHLFVFGRQSCRPSPEIVRAFTSVGFLCDPNVGSWGGGEHFMGSHSTAWASSGRHERALGLLSGLDAVINFHSADANALMAALRRQGTTTIASLHVTDLSEADRPVGHTYLILGFEHAYELITCCSQQMLDWCHAMGIPKEKLSLLRNAPSYDLPAAAVEEALTNRRARGSGPLHVLFLGRFDRQKGLDRLASIVRLGRELGLPIDWRVIGASLIGDGATQDLAPLATAIEPPKLTAQELTECYSWADLLLVVSRWEGLPLTVLEAMRLGVVVCATAVGAVAEVVTHDETGFLLPGAGTPAIARAAVQILRRLATDRGLLRQISSAAAEAAKEWTWETSAKAFVGELDRLTVL